MDDDDDGDAAGTVDLLDPEVRTTVGDPPRRGRLSYTTRVFLALLFASLYLLTRRWREKGRTASAASPADLAPSEIAGGVALAASLLYLVPRIGELLG